MSDPLIREIDNYVILEPGADQVFLDSNETLLWLRGWLEKMKELPDDLKNINSLEMAAKHLLDTACTLEIEKDLTIQWYAVRLEPPS